MEALEDHRGLVRCWWSSTCLGGLSMRVKRQTPEGRLMILMMLMMLMLHLMMLMVLLMLMMIMMMLMVMMVMMVMMLTMLVDEAVDQFDKKSSPCV